VWFQIVRIYFESISKVQSSLIFLSPVATRWMQFQTPSTNPPPPPLSFFLWLSHTKINAQTHDFTNTPFYPCFVPWEIKWNKWQDRWIEKSLQIIWTFLGGANIYVTNGWLGTILRLLTFDWIKYWLHVLYYFTKNWYFCQEDLLAKSVMTSIFKIPKFKSSSSYFRGWSLKYCSKTF